MNQANWTDAQLDAIFAQQNSWDKRGPCLSSDKIVELAFGLGSPEELRELALHAAECKDCRRDWAVARELYQASLKSEVGVQELEDSCDVIELRPNLQAAKAPSTPAPSFSLGRAIANKGAWSSCLLVSAAALCLISLHFSEAPNDIDAESKVVLRSVELPAPELEPFEDSKLFRYSEDRFDWPSTGPACTYTLTFYNDKLDALHHTPVFKLNHLSLTPAMAQDLEDQGLKYWAVLSSGKCASRQSALIELPPAQ